MAQYLIPLTPKSQRFNIILANISYNMVLTWRNTPVAIQPPGWFLDIYDISNNPLITGVPLVTGANLLEQDAYLQLGFQLYVQSEEDPFTPPTYTSLGVSCQLYAVY